MTRSVGQVTRHWLMRGLTVFSLIFFAFLYGFVASRFHWFPYQSLHSAALALHAISEAGGTGNVDGLSTYQRQVDRPTAHWLEHRQTDECLLLSGGAAGHVSAEYPNGALAWIIDRDGKRLHAWPNHPNLWHDAQIVKSVASLSGPSNATGVFMYSNGDLLVTFHGQNTFPFAVGIAKFDRYSQLLWKRELLTHHFFSVADNGHIFVPALEVADSPMSIGNTEGAIQSPTNKIYVDYILELDADGFEVQRINLLESLYRSGRHGALVRFNQMSVETDDPLHLNDVRWLSADKAKGLPGVQEGDLLVSMRNINALAVVDCHTHLMKWFSCGLTIGQHSPRVQGSAILVLDNLGGDAQLGGTRLLQIDYASRQPTSIFPSKPGDMPDLCRTTNCGYLDLHPDGRHALLAVTHGGSVWEVDLQQGKVVWEYIVNDPKQPAQRGKIGLARYLTVPDFLK